MKVLRALICPTCASTPRERRERAIILSERTAILVRVFRPEKGHVYSGMHTHISMAQELS